MRIGEVLSLTRGDVNPQDGVIKVINGKNDVSRFIPVSDSLKQVLCHYAESIDMTDGDKPLFCSSYTGDCLTYSAMKYMFPKMLRAAKIYVSQDASHRPYIYKQRENAQHSFSATYFLHEES